MLLGGSGRFHGEAPFGSGSRTRPEGKSCAVSRMHRFPRSN
ncbi:hypothetical protein SJ05684_b60240 (plasmid) [Sinorhizobium sojae CCBAU 05684]|uniref:Uncharacterized protein n=1 Tax=Sinorhizobium sojae CCBAU 05684 TaxID=716928 RepID=A0A249PMG3_9HYPH|nr:hypothetical protein SJ05684_b60240 [Sinorhizobium sojae CCBAU 05684]